jgi:hypothetical protein
MIKFQYGLQARPFSADPQLSCCKITGIELNPSDEQKKEFGVAIRHGIIETENKLDSEFVAKHELVDLSLLKESSWNRIIKTIDYLVKREKYNMFLTPDFYSQIQMGTKKFHEECVNHGFDCADELYAVREDLFFMQIKGI